MTNNISVELPRSFRLTIIRHAQTKANLAGTFCGARDLPLTPLGHRMAAALFRNPNLVGVEHLISSPFIRARSTARALGDALGLKSVQTDRRLRELEFGNWEGLAPSAVRNQPDFSAWQRNPFENAPPDGETGEQVLSRTMEAVGEALQRFRNVAVVTHKSPARLLTAALGGLEPENFRKMKGFAVSSVTVVHVINGRLFKLLGPSVEHLPPPWRKDPDRLQAETEFSEVPLSNVV